MHLSKRMRTTAALLLAAFASAGSSGGALAVDPNLGWGYDNANVTYGSTRAPDEPSSTRFKGSAPPDARTTSSGC